MTKAVFFYVQHLFGIGHLRRSVAIANSIAGCGIPTYLVSGGTPVSNLGLSDNVELVQLPPVRARNGNFADLVDEQDNPVGESWWQHRQHCLLTAWSDSRAPILMAESYPFARRVMRHELLPLLEATRNQSFSKLNVCSVRDIPQPKSNPKRVAEICEILNQYYDHVLIHGDKNVATLRETFPAVVTDCQDLSFHYTGYVDTESTEVAASSASSDVLVSAGGGAAGLHIYQAAIEAARIDTEHQWRLLIGPNIVDSEYASLVAGASHNVIVERNRPDFRAVLKASSVSVSQAGYNTLVDVLRTNVASVLVPFAKDGEEEQTLRARKFSSFGRAVVVDERSLGPSSLLAAVAQARRLKAGNQGQAETPAVDGAARSAEFVKQWLEAL